MNQLKKNKMKKYYFTFGSNHIAPIGTPAIGESLGNYYVEVEAENMGKARQKMFDFYNDKWSFCYEENQREQAIDRFSLKLHLSLKAD